MREKTRVGAIAAAFLVLVPARIASSEEAAGSPKPLTFRRTAVVVAVRPGGTEKPIQAPPDTRAYAPAVSAFPMTPSEEQRLEGHRSNEGKRLLVVGPGEAESERSRQVGEEALVEALAALGPRATWGDLASGRRMTEADLRTWAAAAGYDGLVLLRIDSCESSLTPDLAGLPGSLVVDARLEAVVVSTRGDQEAWRTSFRVRDARSRDLPPDARTSHPLQLVLPEAATVLASRLRKEGLLQL